MASAPADHATRPVHAWSSGRVATLVTGAQGRPAAMVVAVLLALWYGVLGEQSWSLMRHGVFDTYQRLFPRQVKRLPVVIVDIDEASLASLGRWPWPRTRLAQLIAATHRLGAQAVGLDIIMPEADSLSPHLLLAERQDVDQTVRDALDRLPSNDTILAQTLRQIPSVVARAGLIDGEPASLPVQGQTPVVILGETPLAHVQAYRSHLTSIPEIEAAALGRGYLNDTRDADGVVRTIPLLLTVQGELAPTLALELLRVALGVNWYSVHGSRSGVHGIQLGELFIPTDPDGRIRLHFSPAYAMRRVSALSILHGTQEPASLAHQVAIIGASGIVGISDVVTTPVATRMDGVEIQAQVIENILDGARLIRPVLARWLELVMFLGMAFAFILLPPRLQPMYGVLVFLAGAVIIGAGSLVCFRLARWLLDPSFPTVGNIPILMILLTARLAAADRQRRALDATLEAARLERMRITGELQAAREIQMGMLPAPGAIAGLPANLAFHAILEPAQEVGGDLYDAFMLDEHHFFFLIGDVSGKGISASLFMALSKTLCKSVALRAPASLDALMCTMNVEISHANPADLFVTVLMGVIDARTGEVEFCVAGHDAPILLRSGAPPRVLETVGGPPLCVLDDFPYTTDHIQLQSDDMLVLITDGVTEAQNPEQHFYSLARALAYLTTAHQGQYTPASACQGLYDDVKRFANGAPPSDDITIVAIRFTAPPPCPPPSRADKGRY